MATKIVRMIMQKKISYIINKMENFSDHENTPRLLNGDKPQFDIKNNNTMDKFRTLHSVSPVLLAEIKTPSTKSIPLTNPSETKELEEMIKCNPKLASVFKSPDDVIHSLKVVQFIKAGERFSTNTGVYIQHIQNNINTWAGWVKSYVQPLWFVRMKNGDDRMTNLKVIKALFVGAFVIIEEALQEREKMYEEKNSDEEPYNASRTDKIKKLKNEQLITRMSEAVTNAINSIQNLKETYAEDANTCARIDMLTETVKDRLLLIKTSVEFFK